MSNSNETDIHKDGHEHSRTAHLRICRHPRELTTHVGATARLCRASRLTAVAFLLVAGACTTAAIRPRPAAAPDVYTFRIAFNLFATPSAIEEAAQREMEAFRGENDYADYAVVSGYCLRYLARYCDYLVRFRR